jgi:hypothetical protein
MSHGLADWAERLRRRGGPPCILELIEKSSLGDAEKAAKWKREAELQELLVDTISSKDDL